MIFCPSQPLNQPFDLDPRARVLVLLSRSLYMVRVYDKKADSIKVTKKLSLISNYVLCIPWWKKEFFSLYDD